MGDPRNFKKTYRSPAKPFDSSRISKEKELRKNYAFKTKVELRKMEAVLRNMRAQARMLLGERESPHSKLMIKQVLSRAIRLGLLREGAKLEDILGLKLNDILERRLGTVVVRKGLAHTSKQARQLVTHGKILLGERIITSPSHLVPLDTESSVNYVPGFKGVIVENGRKGKHTEGGSSTDIKASGETSKV